MQNHVNCHDNTKLSQSKSNFDSKRSYLFSFGGIISVDSFFEIIYERHEKTPCDE